MSPLGGSPSGSRLVLILGALSAFGPLSLDLYLPSLPSLARDLHTTTAASALTLTACLIGLAVGQLLSGPLSDQLGRRRPVIVGVAVYAAASGACMVAPNIWTLVALRLLQGFAGAAGIVVARAVVRDLHTGVDAAHFFALLLVINGLVPVIAPVLGSQLLRITDWRGVFGVLGLIGVLLLLAVVRGLPETLPVAARRSGSLRETLRILRRLLIDGPFMGYTICSGLVLGALFAYIAGSPFVLQTRYGLSSQMFSMIFAGNAVGIIAAGQISSRLVGRVTPERLLGAGVFMCGAGASVVLGAACTGAGLPAILPGLFLVVASVGLVLPNATALALADHPHEAGAASALLGLVQFAIGAGAAPFAGIAGSSADLPMALTITALAAGALLAWALNQPNAIRASERSADA